MERRQRSRVQRSWWGFLLLASLGAVTLPLHAHALPVLALSEVFYDRVGPDNGFEWVELYNAGTTTIELGTWSLGYGGTSYAQGGFQLEGSVAPGQYLVVGGPSSDASNGFPSFGLALDFSPDLQNSGSTADGVALFDVTAEQITPALIPVDAVVFGEVNANGLLGPDGKPAPAMVDDAPNGQSIEVTASGSWRVQPLPTPGTGEFVRRSVREPPALGMLGLGLAMLFLAHRRSRTS